MNSRNENPNKRYWWCSAFFFLWLIIVLISYNAALFSKVLVNFFASGTSFFKLYFFLFWSAASFLILGFGFSPKRKISDLWLRFSIIFMAFLGLFSHLLLMSKYRFGFSDSIIAVVNNNSSGNRFFHLHILKAALIYPIKLLGLESVYKMTDPGLPYFFLLPHSLFLGAFLVEILIFILMMYFLIIKEREWRPDLKYPFLCLYVISGFALFKNFFDGGPFSQVFAVFFPAFLALLKIKNRDLGKSLKIFGASLLLSVGSIAAFYYYFADLRELTVFGFGVLGAICTLLLVAISAHWIHVRKRPSWKGLTAYVLLLALWILALCNHFGLADYRYLLKKILPGDRVFIYDKEGRSFPGSLKYREGAGRIYEYRSDHMSKLIDIYRENRFQSIYAYAMVVGPGCSEYGDLHVKGKIRAIETGTLDLNKKSEMLDRFSVRPCSDPQDCDYTYEGTLKGCIPNGSDSIVLNHFTEMGFKKFILLAREDNRVFKIRGKLSRERSR